VVSSTTTGNAEVNPSNSQIKRKPEVAPRLWKSLFNDLKLAARNFSAGSLLGEGGFGCVCGFTKDTSREQPAPPGVTSTATCDTEINSQFSPTASDKMPKPFTSTGCCKLCSFSA